MRTRGKQEISQCRQVNLYYRNQGDIMCFNIKIQKKTKQKKENINYENI